MENNAAKNSSPVAPSSVASTPPPAPQPAPVGVVMTDTQFAMLLKAVTYSLITAGIVFNNPSITASAKNLNRVKDLGDTVLELAGQ